VVDFDVVETAGAAKIRRVGLFVRAVIAALLTEVVMK
jgi:hypothetical protein